MKTLILHHDDCLRHEPGVHHPERPERVTAVLNALRDMPGLEWLPAPKATPEQILRVHDADYWERLVESEPGPDDDLPAVLDPDTFMSQGSLNATLRGSGAACFAVDQVCTGKARNAFCAVRPPGHHAETSVAMGFCLLNHVAVAARHVQSVHAAKRVAILDFDVHHGNGTQDIFDASPDVMYISSHQIPLYPGTGYPHETGCGNVVNMPLSPGAGSGPFREAWETRGLPALDRFDPDFIIVSAGFDAHRADPLGEIELEDEDFAWITEEIRGLAEQHCDGRIISVLEGGYDLAALASAARAHVGALVAQVGRSGNIRDGDAGVV